MENQLQKLVGRSDVYLLDQILKNRYQKGATLLDAGCGTGRNLAYLYQMNCHIYGLDASAEAVRQARKNFPNATFKKGFLENTDFPSDYFDHIICSAVLHFSRDENHFDQQIAEMARLVKPKGTIFIRMTCDIGITPLQQLNHPFRYLLKDGTERFLLTLDKLNQLCQKHHFTLLEPFKTVVVEDKRSMCVLILEKES